MRKELMRKLDEVLKLDDVRTNGFNNASQFADHILRKAIYEIESDQMVLEHQNMSADHVKIREKRPDKTMRIVSVYFKSDELHGRCGDCDKVDCRHIDYLWDIEKIRKILKKKGIKPPPRIAKKINLP